MKKYILYLVMSIENISLIQLQKNLFIKKGIICIILIQKMAIFLIFRITDNGTVIPPQEGNNYTQAIDKIHTTKYRFRRSRQSYRTIDS